MIDPKDVTPGYWYVKSLGGNTSYDIVCVYDGGEVNIIGSDDEHVVQEYIFEFIMPVPPPQSDARTVAAHALVVLRDLQREAAKAGVPWGEDSTASRVLAEAEALFAVNSKTP